MFCIVLVLGFCSTLLLGCASDVKKAEIAATADPHVEAASLEHDINSAIADNIDVLAASEYNQSKSYLRDAKRAMENGKPQSTVLEALRNGRGYLQRAYSLSENRQGKAQGLFAARKMTLKAGAATHPELQSDLETLDDDVAAKADRISDTSTDVLADLQSRYVDLERRAVIINQLGKVQALVNGAQKDGAKDKAPLSYKNAELSVKNAESMISTNVRNPAGYQVAVETANKDAVHLLNVMAVINQNGNNLNETVAIKMVAQNNTISGLTSDLGTVTAQGVRNESVLQGKNQELAVANDKVELQGVLERARKEFSAEEAVAYQQGPNLVIRLKQVNFATGRSDLPANALPLLAKVSNVARSLRPSHITVEGHTDSVGSALENETISDLRAKSVASYFKTNGFVDVKIESEGYGFKKPIATNKSKAGRAQNRRVDVIITPEIKNKEIL